MEAGERSAEPTTAGPVPAVVPTNASPAAVPTSASPAVPQGDELVAPEIAGSWALDLTAAVLRGDSDDADRLFEGLGNKLERILGTRVKVDRAGGFMRKARPVMKITVDLGGERLEAIRERTGPAFRVAHAVRGITLRTDDVPCQQWLDLLIQLVGLEAQRSDAVHQALGRLLET